MAHQLIDKTGLTTLLTALFDRVPRRWVLTSTTTAPDGFTAHAKVGDIVAYPSTAISQTMAGIVIAKTSNYVFYIDVTRDVINTWRVSLTTNTIGLLKAYNISEMSTNITTLQTKLAALESAATTQVSIADALPFAGILNTSSIVLSTSSAVSGTIYYHPTSNRFVIRSGTTYYPSWSGYASYGTSSSTGVIPKAGQIFLDTSTGALYLYGGAALVQIKLS